MNELKKHLESLKSTELSLNEEMGTDLLSQLSTDDQTELDTLNDEIKQVRHILVILLKKELQSLKIILSAEKNHRITLLYYALVISYSLNVFFC